MVMGLLSYVHNQKAYANIFANMDKLFIYYNEEILGSESKLVKARYALFLGYLMDVLYKGQPDAFKHTVHFLYKSVDLDGENKAIALQSIDTLKTITCDQDLIPRMKELNLLPELVQMIQASMQAIPNHEYLEFLKDFIQTYYEILGPAVITLIQTIVGRINHEIASGRSQGGDEAMFTQKCINILEHVTSMKNFMSQHADALEQAYIPIFEHMVDPTKINFENDILIILKNFIKRTQKVSDIIYRVLPCLEKVFTKNKFKFGDDTLMDTLNYYLIFGRDKIMADQAAVQMLLHISDQAMFCTERTVTINNAEGAIFLQIIF